MFADESGVAWRCYRRCLLDLPDTDWLLVIQDDALPCEGFVDALGAILPRCEHPVCLFLPVTALRSRMAFWEAQAEGCDLAPHDPMEWVPTVAICWPVYLAARFLAWTDEGRYADSTLADDEIVGRWARHDRQDVCVAVPSLVEHPDLVPSLINRAWRSEGRVALSFRDDLLTPSA